jgi:hypothetical protein
MPKERRETFGMPQVFLAIALDVIPSERSESRNLAVDVFGRAEPPRVHKQRTAKSKARFLFAAEAAHRNDNLSAQADLRCARIHWRTRLPLGAAFV